MVLDLPRDWTVSSLEDLVAKDRPICYGVLKPGPHVPDGVPLVRIVDVADGEVRLDELHHVSTQLDTEFSRSRLEGGEILLSIQGTIGRVAIVPPELNGGNISRTLARIAVDRSNLATFVAQWMRSNLGQAAFDEAVVGTTRSSLNIGALRKLRVPLPPIAEQRKIAAILSNVDDAVAATRKVIEQTKRVKQGLLHTLMTCGIGHTRFKKTDIGKIPEAWKVVPLAEVCAHITKGATPTTYGYEWVDGDSEGILFLRSECVSEDGFQITGSERISEAAHDSMSRSEIQGGDVLVTITGNVGRVAQVPADIARANINQHIARVRVERSDLLQDFVFHALQMKRQRDRFETIVTGLAYPQLSLKQIRETVVPVPSLREQEAIVARVSAVGEVLRRAEESLHAWERMKRGLMQDLLTGRVRVHLD